MKELKGLFKMCAGCSHLEELPEPNEGKFYCNTINENVRYSRDAMNCEYYDGKNVVLPKHFEK
ncbi:MAG: hypothetical protein J6W30_05295 [Bacteroidales bacterium]|nr:hypothetical protein [Bacteroidales bacterium]